MIRQFLTCLGTATLLLVGTATLPSAAEPPVANPLSEVAGTRVVAYTQAAFEAARAAGRTIVAHVTMPECGFCQLQYPIVGAISQEAEFTDVVFLAVDLASNPDFLETHGVEFPTILIVFNGEREVAREGGLREADDIRALIRKGARI